MRKVNVLAAIICGMLALVVGVLGVLLALGRETRELTTLVVTAIVPTITSVMAIARSEQACKEIRRLNPPDELDPNQ